MPTKNAKRSTSFIRLLLAGRCSQRHPCTGAQNGANSPLGFRLQTRPKRRKSLPGARRRRGPLALSLAGRSTMVYRKGQPRRKGTGASDSEFAFPKHREFDIFSRENRQGRIFFQIAGCPSELTQILT